jgi:SAM-dependent methyltransferase
VRLVSGERASTGAAGFRPSWQRHRAAYRLVADFLPEGLILDLGCGVGHSWRCLAQRPTVGVDVAATVLAGQGRPAVGADLRALPFRDWAFDGLLSSHSIEHVPDPGRGVAEAARVIRPGGVAVFVTPNRLTFGRPDEVIDPYHFVEYDPHQLRDLCASRFESVEVLGIVGSDRYLEITAEEHLKLDRMLAFDPLRARRAVPRRARQAAYDVMLTWSRRKSDPRRDAITMEDFTLGPADLEHAADLVAVCRGPGGCSGGVDRG